MIREILQELFHLIPGIMLEVAIALLPIIVMFLVFQFTLVKLPKSRLIKMGAGMAYAYVGLVLFFIGVEIGFTQTGDYLGKALGSLPHKWILIPIGLVIGFSVVLAEPAVRSLVNQVEAVTGGMIHKSTIYVSLCIGVAISVALAMLRAIYGISFWYFIIPGYLTALILTKFSPTMFTSIAFDAGGVATGPMTSTFVLFFTVGITTAINEASSAADTFGVVAFVAMTPLITIQILGIIYQQKAKLAESIISNDDFDELLFKETIYIDDNRADDKKGPPKDQRSFGEEEQTHSGEFQATMLPETVSGGICDEKEINEDV